MNTITSENKILIVDPESENLELFKLLLKDQFLVYLAQTPGEAFKILEKEDIKVIIADQLQMDMSATEFFRLSAERFPRAERILITGTIDNEVILDAIEVGKVFHYVLKPFRSKNLQGIIDKAIEKHNLQKQNDVLILGLKQSNKELEYILSKLKDEEEKFRDIFNATNDPIIIIDKQGLVIELNSNAKDNFGINNSDECNLIDFVHPDYHQRTKRFLMMLQLSEKSLFETLMKNADNQWKSYEINGHEISFLGNNASLLILRDTTERKETEKKVLQAIIQTEESERRRFAQELHDGIGPLLSTAKLYLQWILKPNAKIDFTTALHKIEETLEETIMSVREVSNKLSPNTLVNFGLEAAINSILERISAASELNCKLYCDIPKRLEFDMEATIFRIIGESINNTIKHAQAKNINIQIIRGEKSVDILYQDDGKGFDVETVLNGSGGNGLANMSSRVVSMDGTIEFKSEIGKGTTIKCKFFL
ncbi:MAG: PAS domain S-box protein [Marinilabiliaceae bacterium]|nr:PAS domain S-box protein [Marinilabiliaceae bacterium]